MTVHKRPLRVCHLAATSEGATWMFEQLRDLRDRHGYEVAAVVPKPSGRLVDLLRSANIPVHVCDLGLDGESRAASLLRAMLQLVRLFRSERFDVVQTHIFPTILAARPAAWIANVPVRLSMIAGPFHLEARPSRLVERLTQWMETALIPSCEKSLRLCRELGFREEKLRLIYYSVDTARFAPGKTQSSGLRDQYGWSADTPLIVQVAHFYPRFGHGGWTPRSLHGMALKGHEDLIRAVPRVLEQFPKARFALVGGPFGPTSDSFNEARALVAQLGLAHHVVFTGHRADVNGILRDTTVAVQASLCENLGGTIEALAMGVPVLATRVGGMPDVVRDGATGRLAEPRNPEDLAEKLCDLLGDPDRARQMGENGRALVSARFSLERTADDLHALYVEQSVAASRRRTKASLTLTMARTLIGVPWLTVVWLAVRASASAATGASEGAPLPPVESTSSAEARP